MAELRRFIQQARAFTAILNGRGLVTYAASCAFYSFLSLFPIAALAAALVPCAGISRAALLHLIHGFAPDGVAPMLQAILLTVCSNVFPALPLSLLALPWSAAKALSELLKGMAAMTGADASVGYFRRRLQAVWLIGAMLTVFLLSLGLLVFGVRIALLAERLYPSLKGWLVLILRLRHVVMALFYGCCLPFFIGLFRDCAFPSGRRGTALLLAPGPGSFSPSCFPCTPINI